jgi:hypothetical protein
MMIEVRIEIDIEMRVEVRIMVEWVLSIYLVKMNK